MKNFNYNNPLMKKESSNINIYTNPVLGELIIDNPNQENCSIEIIKIIEKVVTYNNQIKSTESIKKIDLSNYSKGTYIIQILSETKSFARKIVIE